MNIQYLIYEGKLYVIEVNPRASRTIPYLSKVTGVHMVDIATRVMMGASLEELGCPDGLLPPSPVYGVKAPVFSFEKLPDANSLLGPEMKSTGEVLGVGRTLKEAIYKAMCAAGYSFLSAPGGARRGVLLSVENRQLGEIEALVRKLDAEGLHMFATPDTANAIKALAATPSTSAPSAARRTSAAAGARWHRPRHLLRRPARRHDGRLHRAAPPGHPPRHPVHHEP